MAWACASIRRSDGKKLYFYDGDTQDRYIEENGGEDAFEFAGMAEVPFMEKVIDYDTARSNFHQLCRFTNIDPSGLTDDQIHGICGDSDKKPEDTQERIKENMKKLNKVFITDDDGNSTVVDDDGDQINMRKQMLETARFFKYTYEGLSEEDKKLVDEELSSANIDMNDYDGIVNRAINANLDKLTTEVDSKEAAKKVMEEFNEQDDIKEWHNFVEKTSEIITNLNEKWAKEYEEAHKDDVKEAPKEVTEDTAEEAASTADDYYSEDDAVWENPFMHKHEDVFKDAIARTLEEHPELADEGTEDENTSEQ